MTQPPAKEKTKEERKALTEGIDHEIEYRLNLIPLSLIPLKQLLPINAPLLVHL